MRFRLRPRFRLGPIRFNFTENGYSSWSIDLWRWTWNSKRGWSFDTPGPGSVHFGGSRR